MTFRVNQFVTIKKMKFPDDKIHEFVKFGALQPYKEFTGFIDDKKVKGFVCLTDDQVYKLEYIN